MATSKKKPAKERVKEKVKAIKAKVERQLNTDEVAEPNVFSCIAAEAALTQGKQWLEECREVFRGCKFCPGSFF